MLKPIKQYTMYCMCGIQEICFSFYRITDNVITSLLPATFDYPLSSLNSTCCSDFLLFCSFNLNAYDTLMAFNVTPKWICIRNLKIIEQIHVIYFSVCSTYRMVFRSPASAKVNAFSEKSFSHFQFSRHSRKLKFCASLLQLCID